MDENSSWLVCASRRDYLYIAATLVASGCAAAIEWVADPARACTCAARRRAFGRTDVVVGALEGGAPSSDAACTLAGLVDGTTVLCLEGAANRGEELRACGVNAVEPDGLFDLLAREAGRPVREGLPNDGPVCAAMPEAGAEVPIAQVCDVEEPDFAPRVLAGDGSAAGAPACTPGAGVDVREDDGVAGLRTMGRLPRTGIPEHPVTARPLTRSIAVPAIEGEEVSDEPGALGGGPMAVESSVGTAYPRVEGRVVAGIATEPVAFRPVVTLPQLECAVPDGGEHVPTVCFTSARGGVGKSSLAIMVALSLAHEGLSVALIDLDFQFGTCLGYLGADETDGLFDTGVPPQKLCIDDRMLARCRTVPQPRLTAFEFCKAPEHAELLSGMAGRLVRCASAGSDVAIVDLPPGIGEAAVQALEMADRCLLVSDQRAFSIESLVAHQALCARMGIARTKLVTVMNRCDARHRDEGFLSRVQFEVQTPQIVRVADGGAEVMQMLAIGSAGELVSMRNRFALSAADFAHALSADLGCRAAASPAAFAAPVRLPELSRKAGPQRRRKKEKRGELEPCPF